MSVLIAKLEAQITLMVQMPTQTTAANHVIWVQCALELSLARNAAHNDFLIDSWVFLSLQCESSGVACVVDGKQACSSPRLMDWEKGRMDKMKRGIASEN